MPGKRVVYSLWHPMSSWASSVHIRICYLGIWSKLSTRQWMLQYISILKMTDFYRSIGSLTQIMTWTFTGNISEVWWFLGARIRSIQTARKGNQPPYCIKIVKPTWTHYIIQLKCHSFQVPLGDKPIYNELQNDAEKCATRIVIWWCFP